MHRPFSIAAASLLLAACNGSADSNISGGNDAAMAEPSGPANAQTSLVPATTLETVTPVDDPAAVAEEPFGETSAQGAANVVRTYYAMLGAARFGEARRLWSNSGEASGMTEEAFANAMAKYQEYQAEVGAPGPIEGAAGSLYVEVPVRVHGIVRGEPFNLEGPVRLRRCNDVPGCTEEQLAWRIADIGLRPSLQQ